MSITLKEMKNYLRVDGSEDDTLIRSLIGSSERLCMDVIRTDDVKILYGSCAPCCSAQDRRHSNGNRNLKRTYTDL